MAQQQAQGHRQLLWGKRQRLHQVQVKGRVSRSRALFMPLRQRQRRQQWLAAQAQGQQCRPTMAIAMVMYIPCTMLLGRTATGRGVPRLAQALPRRP